MSDSISLFSPNWKFMNNDETVDPVFITGWSFLHAVSGYMLATIAVYLGFNSFMSVLLFSNIIHFLYEANDYHKMYNTEVGYIGAWSRNSLFNSVGDQLSMNIGAIIFLLTNNSSVSFNELVITTTVYLVLFCLFYYAWPIFKIG